MLISIVCPHIVKTVILLLYNNHKVFCLGFFFKVSQQCPYSLLTICKLLQKWLRTYKIVKLSCHEVFQDVLDLFYILEFYAASHKREE